MVRSQFEAVAEFRERYRAELDDNPAIETMRVAIQNHKHVTLLYGAHDREHKQAVVLKEYLGKADRAPSGINPVFDLEERCQPSVMANIVRHQYRPQ